MLEEVVGLFVTFVAVVVVVVKFEPVDDVLVTVEPCDGIFVGVILFVIFVDVVSLVYSSSISISGYGGYALTGLVCCLRNGFWYWDGFYL